MNPTAEILVFKSSAELFDAAAIEFAKLANQAVRDRGRFCVALSGGSTPQGLYSQLATGKIAIPWEDVCFFWGDERHVPPDDPSSNFRMADEALLSKIPAQRENIFRIHSEENDAALAAQWYEETLVEFFGLKQNAFPRFDLVLLGIGTEGHTASLFPGSKALEEKTRLVMANWVEKLETDRITVTFPLLNEAREVMFLASGKEKSEIVKEILKGNSKVLPAQRVNPTDGKLLWLLDQAAASMLSTLQI